MMIVFGHLVLFIVTASFQFMLPKAAYAFQGGL
jgi:hypothetical protein